MYAVQSYLRAHETTKDKIDSITTEAISALDKSADS